ncbi:MAG: hypothetical protein ACREXM_20020, partial [Gammaproteobacteria bacterium]
MRAGLRPPLKLHVRFSRMQLSRRRHADLLLLDFLAPCADYAGVGWVPMRRLRLVWRMADRAAVS